MISKNLEKIGFTEKEALVYLACLELGESNIQQISKKSGIKRTTVYDVIESIKERGIISTVTINKKIHYYAEDPRTIEDSLEEKKGLLRRILPELLSVTNIIDKKPKIRFFEGVDGIKEVYKDTLRFPGQELIGWGSPKATENFDAEFLTNYYIPARLKDKISVRAIANQNEVWNNLKLIDEKSLRKTRLVNKNLPFDVEIDLYGGRCVAVFAFEEKIALIIESEKIYTTLKSIFEMSWESLE